MNAASSIDLQSMRVDLVGSLLRPRSVKEVFAKYGEGKASEADLKQLQDDAIRDDLATHVAQYLRHNLHGDFRGKRIMVCFTVPATFEEWQARVKTYHE